MDWWMVCWNLFFNQLLTWRRLTSKLYWYVRLLCAQCLGFCVSAFTVLFVSSKLPYINGFVQDSNISIGSDTAVLHQAIKLFYFALQDLGIIFRYFLWLAHAYVCYCLLRFWCKMSWYIGSWGDVTDVEYVNFKLIIGIGFLSTSSEIGLK